MAELTHFDERGASRMVDVSAKEVTAADGAGERPGPDGAGDAGADPRPPGWPRGTCSRSPGWPGSWRRSGPAT